MKGEKVNVISRVKRTVLPQRDPRSDETDYSVGMTSPDITSLTQLVN